MDSGCTRDIISMDIVKDLGLKMMELQKPLNIVSADGSILNIVGTTSLYFSSQATSQKRRMIHAAVLAGGKDRELLISLKNLKKMRMIHPTFPNETIDNYFLTYKNKREKEYSSVYKAATLDSYYTKSRSHLKKPSKESQSLQNKLIEKHKHNFVDKLGKHDRLRVKPIELQVDKEKLAQAKPTGHLKPYNVPFHLRQGFENELLNMIEAGIIEQYTTPTQWNTKAFPVQKSSDPSKCRIVGDFRGLNNVLLKLYWHTESSNQLLRHIDPQARYFCVIDATTAFHQVPVSEEASKLLTIVTNAGRFSYRVLSQGVCNSSALWNILTEGNSRINSELSILKNMDDYLIHARTLEDLEKKLEKFMEFAKKKNLKLNPKKFFILEEVEFDGSKVITEKCQNNSLIFISPKNKRIKFFEELRKS